MINCVSGYRFSPSDLKVSVRRPGVSAFMRIRNGADFLEATIRSHIEFFDEIVAVYNQCTDATPEILFRLEQEYGSKLTVWHYTDRVFPPGSEGHAKTEPTSPASMVNYSNFALSRTTRQIVTKLDDDHLAMPRAMQEIVARVRDVSEPPSVMHCFCGLNLIRTADGNLGIPETYPFSGSGDIGLFRVSPKTVFAHDRRYERAPRQGLTRKLVGFAYWHLKYLKQGMGFANYELEQNPHSRFTRRKAVICGRRMRILTLEELVARTKNNYLGQLAAVFSQKGRLLWERNTALTQTFAGLSLDQSLEFLTDPALRTLAFRERVPA